MTSRSWLLFYGANIQRDQHSPGALPWSSRGLADDHLDAPIPCFWLFVRLLVSAAPSRLAQQHE